MPAPSLASSSTKSKDASTASRQSAQAAAQKAFAAEPPLPFDADVSKIMPVQGGKSRLRGAFEISIDLLERDPEQPRTIFDSAELSELTKSIASRGFQQILKVRPSPGGKRYRIIDGERRWRAAQKARLKTVPCWIYEAEASPQDIFVDQIVANWQRADLQPYETADAVARLRDKFGMTPTQISAGTGKPKSEITKLLALVDNVDSSIQVRVRLLPEISLTKRHLYNLSQQSPAEQVRLAAKIEREHLTAVETEQLIKQQKADRHAASAIRRFRYKAGGATVVVSFEKQHVEPDEVLHALGEAKRLAKEEFGDFR